MKFEDCGSYGTQVIDQKQSVADEQVENNISFQEERDIINDNTLDIINDTMRIKLEFWITVGKFKEYMIHF